MGSAGIAYATDDVVSKVMGEVVLPGMMKKAGIEPKLSVTFQSQAFDMAPQVSQLLSQPTDLIGVGSGPEAATRLVQEMRRQGHKGRLIKAPPTVPRNTKLISRGAIQPAGEAGNSNVAPVADPYAAQGIAPVAFSVANLQAQPMTAQFDPSALAGIPGLGQLPRPGQK